MLQNVINFMNDNNTLQWKNATTKNGGKTNGNTINDTNNNDNNNNNNRYYYYCYYRIINNLAVVLNLTDEDKWSRTKLKLMICNSIIMI